jgi:hypothetical protein
MDDISKKSPFYNTNNYRDLFLLLLVLVLLRFPPKNRNIFYGYRTISSMKSPERWEFAQIKSGKEAIRLGILLTLSSLIGFVYNPSEIISVFVGLGLMLMTIIIMLFRIEKSNNT